ncbi:MAG TPA: deoxyribonuclease IV [Pirellulales bacterium]|nr:deoxyribonuclease IV [Pirellulales bacterium]
MLLGAHMSIAGGYYRAVEHAQRCGCDCVQLFTKNNNQWKAKPITDEEAEKFRDALAASGVSHPISHDSYLINLATPDDDLWRRSIDAFVVELQRAEQLGIAYVVMHPGAYVTSTEAAGLARVVEALDEVHRQTPELSACTLLETTAGQGTALGWRFEHLAEIKSRAKSPERLGVCLDTCHVFAAGYPLQTPEEYESTMQAFDTIVGTEEIKAFHLNDSKKGLGSRVDRHDHIGEGMLGLEPFRHLLNDPRFRQTPMYLETPKGQTDGLEWDVMNLKKLRELTAAPGRAKRRSRDKKA